MNIICRAQIIIEDQSFSKLILTILKAI